MGDFAQAIGNGISGLIAGSFDVIGAALRGMVDTFDQALPGGLLAGVMFVVLAVVAWQLIKR